MKTSNSSPVFAAAVGAGDSVRAGISDPGAVSSLLDKIKSNDDQVRGAAWQTAGPCGAAAVPPLGILMADPEPENARAATRALGQIVRHAGRPGAEAERQAVTRELIALLAAGSPKTQRDVLWMLSEIGRDEAVAAMAALLSDQDLREDARLTLERIPGAKAIQALHAAFGKAPERFKYALAQSLRARGEKVEGYPSQKLLPTKPTSVKPE